MEGIQGCRNIFQIPSYFGYILRSSVLEGIGLASDKNYSIANEHPYVARRLLTDDSPRPAVRSSSSSTARAVPRRSSACDALQPANAFGNYSVMTVKDEKQVVDADGAEGTATNPRLSKGAKEAPACLRAGGPVQDIVLREMARYAGAAAAELASSAASGPASVVVSLAEAQQAAAAPWAPRDRPCRPR